MANAVGNVCISKLHLEVYTKKQKINKKKSVQINCFMKVCVLLFFFLSLSFSLCADVFYLGLDVLHTRQHWRVHVTNNISCEA